MKASILQLRKRYLFAWDGALLTVSGLAAGFILFVYHAFMKRMLGENDYASIVALLGLLNVMNLPVAAITFTMSRFVAEHVHDNAVAAWVTIYKRAMQRINLFAIGGLLIWILFSGVLADFFAAPSVAAIIILGFIAAIKLYGPVITGVLQGSRSFGYLALVSFANPFLRLIFCVLAVWLGARVAGIMGAVAVSILVSMFIATIPFRKIVGEVEALPDYDTGPVYRYLLPVFLSQGAFLLLMNADIVFFKRFLYGEYGDLKSAYAQAATLSRAVIFIAQPIAIAMFPRAVNSSRKIIFFGPFLFAAAVSALLALAITIFPEIPFKIMYNTDDPACFAIARRYVWAALPLSLTAITLKYLWARHKTGKALLLLPSVTVYLALLYFFHRTPAQIVACLAVGSWLSLLLLAVAALGTKQRVPMKEAAAE